MCEYGKYIPLAGFVARLTENITYKTRHLPIDESSYQILLDNLADDDYSFLEIRDGNAIEVVKVINVCDKIMIERGAQQTRHNHFGAELGSRTFKLCRVLKTPFVK